MPPKIIVESVRQIYNDGLHNAFTDLCRFRGRLYLTFRNCPDGHMIYASSRILVLASADGRDWRTVCTFNVPGRDVRDPHFCIFADRLFVYTGTWLVGPQAPNGGDMDDHQGYGVWSADGESWHGPYLLLGTHGYYIWRAAAYGDMTYLCGRCKVVPGQPLAREERRAYRSVLLGSRDGLSWSAVGLFQEEYGDETAFLFEADGSILAVARDGNNLRAQVCRARPPYKVWKRTELSRNIGGPLLARWGADYLVGGRDARDPHHPKTALAWLVDDQLCEAAQLPSGGDTSYPGFVALSATRGLLSYYSSHEGSGTSQAPSAIYLAELRKEV